jgi:hypothetical protein
MKSASENNLFRSDRVSYYIDLFDHNHTNTTTAPSGQPKNGYISGDIGVAQAIDALNGNSTAKFNIYSPHTGEYYPEFGEASALRRG